MIRVAPKNENDSFTAPFHSLSMTTPDKNTATSPKGKQERRVMALEKKK